MVNDLLELGHGDIDAFIFQALVRKLIEKNVLTIADLRELLFEAAGQLRPVGGSLTPQAKRTMVESDLLPAFLTRRNPGPVGQNR